MNAKFRQRIGNFFRRRDIRGILVLMACVVGATAIVIGALFGTGVMAGGVNIYSDDDTWSSSAPQDNTPTTPNNLPGTGLGTTAFFSVGERDFDMYIGEKDFTVIHQTDYNAITYFGLDYDVHAITAKITSENNLLKLRITALDRGFVTITIRAMKENYGITPVTVNVLVRHPEDGFW